MQAIANVAWICGRCGFAMLASKSETTKEYREVQCAHQTCANAGIRYKEPQIVADLEAVEQGPKLAVARP